MSTTTLDQHADTALGWELVDRAQAGDMDAFGQLYERYRAVVFRFVMFRVADRPLAEDITGETFTKALEKVSTVSYVGRDVGAWFVTIARNLVLDHKKKSSTKLEIKVGSILDPDSRWSAENPERDAITLVLRELLDGAIAQLNPVQRRVIAQRFLLGMTVAETSEEMGCNHAATKARQHRAVARLREILRAHAGPDLVSA